MNKTQREVLQDIYKWFLSHDGEWPYFDSIDRHVNRYRERPLDTGRVLRRVSPKFLMPLGYVDDRPDPRGRVVLRLAGVARCQGSGDDVERFMAALRWIIRKNKGYDPPPEKVGYGLPISAEQLASELELPLTSDPSSIKRLMALLEAEGLVSDDEHS